MKNIKTKKIFTMLVAVFIVVSLVAGMQSEAFARAKAKKPSRIDHKSIKVKPSKESAAITFKKGRDANNYTVFYKAKKAKKWQSKTIKTKKSKVQSVTLRKLKAGTVYYVKVQGFQYKKIGKTWKKIKNKRKKADKYKKTAGKVSKVISFKTKTSGEESISEKEFASKAIREDKNVRLEYGDAKIYIGQAWTEELKVLLEKKSDSAVKKYLRPKFIEYNKVKGNEKSGEKVAKRLVDCEIYCYGTKDYGNFLRINVVSGKIFGWETNGKVIGTVDGKEVKRGTVTDGYKSRGAVSTVRKFDKVSKKWFEDLPEKATLIGGFSAKGSREGKIYYGVSANYAGVNEIKGGLGSDEKMLGLHYTNAVRAIAGSKPLEYNEFLDGGEKTWKCTEEFVEFIKNIANGDTPKLKVGDVTRYGAQAMAETVNESVKAGQKVDNIEHSMKKCIKGPLANQTGDERRVAIFHAAGKTCANVAGNNGTGGYAEAVVASYFGEKSDPKCAEQILYPDSTRIGIGFSGGHHVEEFGH